MKHPIIDLNCDLGENFGMWKIGDNVDDAILPMISSANIACGFHAGDPNMMHKTVEQAKKYDVGIGAHPGFSDLVGFGRRHIDATPKELINDIIYQIGSLREFARFHGVTLQHVKPHGALYMHAARDEEFARLLIEAIQKIEPTLYLLCMESSNLYRIANELKQPIVREFYADRNYSENGSIVFRRNVEKLNPDTVAKKVLMACQKGVVKTDTDKEIPINFESICIHSDTPGALDLVSATKEILEKNNIQIASIKKLMPTLKV